MSDELSKSRGSVAFSLLPLPFFCLPLSLLCLPLTFLRLFSQLGFLFSQLGFLFSFFLCLEEKRFVVRGAASTHCFCESE
jgi:hypothetical protein